MALSTLLRMRMVIPRWARVKKAKSTTTMRMISRPWLVASVPRNGANNTSNGSRCNEDILFEQNTAQQDLRKCEDEGQIVVERAVLTLWAQIENVQIGGTFTCYIYLILVPGCKKPA